MSLRPGKPLVLTFALGALALGAVMVYLFGGRQIFTRHERFLLYFDDTVNGLAPGSLVMFKGVPIGSVDAIRFNFRASPADRRIPVLIKLNADLLQRQLGVLEDLSDPMVLAAEVHRGLRGELEVEHYTTGAMFVSLDYYPNAPQPPPEPDSGNFAVIPTVSSSALAHIDWAEKKIAWLPTFDFEAQIGRVDDYLDKLTDRVSVIPYAEYHQKVVDTLQPLADFNFPAWQRNLNNMVDHFDNAQAAIATASSQYVAASQDFVDMNTAVRQNLAQTDASLAAARAQISPTAPWLKQLDSNLKELSTNLQELTQKADNLEAQPDILPQLAKPPRN
jgi:paraquat-inducible protein B